MSMNSHTCVILPQPPIQMISQIMIILCAKSTTTLPRRTELFIVLTMCNEDEGLFCRTMQGVIKNIAHLCQRDRSKTWGTDAWKKVVVSDGRQNINARTLAVIATMGAYQEGIAKVSLVSKFSLSDAYCGSRTLSSANLLPCTFTSTPHKVRECCI
jgi:hypothetical protein